jgi:hypothetical protein
MLSLHQIVGVGACQACRGRITRVSTKDVIVPACEVTADSNCKCSTDKPICSECRDRGTQCKYLDPLTERRKDVSSDPLPINAVRQETIDMRNLKLEDPSQETSSPVNSGMEEVHDVIKALGINPHTIRVSAFPLEETTTEAVEDFLSGTGSLLQFWNEDESLQLIKSVYHQQSDSTSLQATEVFAMAAVGSCCDGRASTSSFQEKFLHLFLCMLSSPSDISDLRLMRLFASLAICRFTNNVESARRLMCKHLILWRG